MTPERTNYLTNGVDGIKRLAQGPELSSYRGLQIIPTRKFSMDAGTAPRDLLKRRVRVAEYYRIPYHKDNVSKMYEFYDQSRDTMFKLTYEQLVEMADLGTSDSGSDGSGKYKHGKRGVKFVHSRGWNPDTISDSVVIEPDGASDEDGLSLPSLLLNDGSRDRKKFRRADVTGANLSVASCNVPIKDAVLSIEKSDYHVASETFGAGLFNDPIQKGEPLKCNFDAIDSANHSIAETFAPYLMTLAMDHLKMQTSMPYFSDIPGLEKSIENGEGVPTTADAIIKLVFHRACQQNMISVRIDKGRILDTSSLEIMQKLADTGEEANFQSNFKALEKDLERFFSTNNVKTIYNNKDLAGIYTEFTGGRGPTLNNQLNNAKTVLKNLFKSSCSECENVVIEPAALATIEYNEFLRKWSSDIVLENAIDTFITPKDVQAYHPKPNMQAHGCFNEIKSMVKCDFIAKRFADTVDGNFVTTRTAATPDNLRSIWSSFQTGLLKTIYETFIEEIHTHTERAVIASNVANSGYCQEAFRPNLHISRCEPLRAEDMNTSPSSMNENTWLIQHLASMMPLTKTMCDTLTAKSGLVSGDNLMKEYKLFLTGNHNHTTEDPYDTFLMHWLMSKIHPDHKIRTRAQERCKVSDNDEEFIVNAIAGLLRNNTTFDDAIESAFEELCQGSFVSNCGKSFYCPGVAATKYPNIPLRLPRDDQHYATVAKDVNWMNMPILDKTFPDLEEDNGTYYNTLSGSNESTVNTECASVKLPWIFELSTSFASNMSDNAPSMSGLSCHWFPMSFDTGHMDGNKYKQPICDRDLEYMLPGNVAMCTSQPHVVILNLLLVLANRFWKPTSRAMMNGVGLPIAVTTRDPSIARAAAFRTPNQKSSPDTGSRTWVVEGTGCHLMHGPTLPSVGGGGGVGGVGAHDIVILRPNIEHEMLGIIMGRGGTQELGATFWGQTELSCYDDAQHGVWG